MLLDKAFGSLRSDPMAALIIVQDLLAIDAFTQSPELKIEALLIVSRAYINMGRYSEAETVAHESNRLAVEGAFPILEARALNELGILRFVDKNYANAVQHYDVAEHILVSIPDKHVLRNVKLNKANALSRLHHFNQAATNYEEALKLAEEFNDELTQGKILMGLVELNSGAYRNPLTCYELSKKAVRIFENLNDEIGMQKSNQNLGYYGTQCGKFDEAIDAYQISINLASKFNEPSALYGSHYGLIHVLIEIDELEAASVVFEKMMANGDTRDSSDRRLYTILSKTELLSAQGNHNLAADELRQFRRDADREKSELFTLQHLEMLAKSLYAAHRYAEAATSYKELFASVKASDDVYADDAIQNLQERLRTVESKATSEIHRIKDVELKDAVDKKNTLLRENQTFVSLLAHELKSPLQTIRAIAGLMNLEESLKKEEIAEYAEDLKVISNKMFDLVTRVLDSVRGTSSLIEKTINARTVWDYVIQQSKYKAEYKGILLQTTFDAEEYPVQASEQSLITILDNVLSNAIKYSPENTQILVTVSTIEAKEQRLVRIVVSDQGPGIPHIHREKLFRPFTTLVAHAELRDDSTGLGLHLAKRDVEALNGKIECNESDDPGASFVIELPLWIPSESCNTIVASKFSSVS